MAPRASKMNVRASKMTARASKMIERFITLLNKFRLLQSSKQGDQSKLRNGTVAGYVRSALDNYDVQSKHLFMKLRK